jgi:hypothetical protein
MSDEAKTNVLPANTFNDGLALELPEFRGLPAIKLDITSVQEAERRALEAKNVNPANYSDLEMCFSNAFRDLKRHLSTVTYQISKTENELEKAKASALFDRYPEFMKGRPKSADTADTRKAFLALDSEVCAYKDRLDSLKALEFFLEGRVKLIERLSSHMKKSIDLIIRSGTTPLYYK